MVSLARRRPERRTLSPPTSTAARGSGRISERALEEILETMAGGQLRGLFCHEFPIKRWILDFYLFEVRVGIEVDGGYHTVELQRDKDEQKTADCEGVGITILSEGRRWRCGAPKWFRIVRPSSDPKRTGSSGWLLPLRTN